MTKEELNQGLQEALRITSGEIREIASYIEQRLKDGLDGFPPELAITDALTTASDLNLTVARLINKLARLTIYKPE